MCADWVHKTDLVARSMATYTIRAFVSRQRSSKPNGGQPIAGFAGRILIGLSGVVRCIRVAAAIVQAQRGATHGGFRWPHPHTMSWD